jgi:hypothetical protein
MCSLGALAAAAALVWYRDKRAVAASGQVSLTTAAAAVNGTLGMFSPLLPITLNPTIAQQLRDRPIKV